MVSDPSATMLGSVLEGRYRVLQLAGRGGMGDVYIGEDTRLKRRCALKILHPELTADRTHVERFLREAQMIASLEHRNIVEIYSYGEDPSGLVFFAMELLVGEDLDARLKCRDERPFDAHDCCLWAIQVAQAVGVVHDAGLIHRDLKASNVFLARRRDGDLCKLLDFGIARAVDTSELTRTGVTLGTPSYMSPEQIHNLDVDRRSDIYSFGVLLFKLLTGRAPFIGEPIQVAMQHCNTPPEPPSVAAPFAGISPALDAIVLKALAKKPDDRFQSMAEVEAALVELLLVEAPDLAPAAPLGRQSSHSNIRSRFATGMMPAISISAGVAPFDETPGSAPSHASVTDADTPQPSWPTPRRALVLPAVLVVCAISVAVLVFTRVWRSGSGPSADTPTAEQVAALTVDAEAPPREIEPVPVPEIDDAQDLPPLEPELPPASEPSKTKRHKSYRPTISPMKQIERKAKKCRKTHKAVGGPKITIDYAIGIDGKVTRSIPSSLDPLGKCLAAAVASTRFEPELLLGRRISL